MCPSCWTAWNECYNGLKEKYKRIIDNINNTGKSDEFNLKLNVNIYSIKPYIISKEHPFVKDIIIENTDANKLNINDVNNWDKPELRNKIRQSDVKFKDIGFQNENYTCSIQTSVKQIADLEGLNMMKQYRNNREQFTRCKTQLILNKVNNHLYSSDDLIRIISSNYQVWAFLFLCYSVSCMVKFN